MKNQAKAKSEEKIVVKLGSDDMVFWDKTIRETEYNLKSAKNDIKLYDAILNIARKKYKQAEEENNKTFK